MPLMYLHYPEGTFTPEALNTVANQITRDGEELEKLPLTDWVLSTTWVYAREYHKEKIFHGGKPGGAKFISLDINVIQGGYSATTKTELIKRVTNTIGKHANLPEGEPRRIYVLIREVAEGTYSMLNPVHVQNLC